MTSASPPGGAAPATRKTSRTAAELQALLETNLAATQTGGPHRVVLAPAGRPYARVLVHALGTKLDEATLGWFLPTDAELQACERRFLETAHAELVAGKISIVQSTRAFALEPMFAAFATYERQAVGWSANGARYVYLRFRLPSPGQPPLVAEYVVMDGGSAYFEMQCELAGTRLFAVEVNGES